MIPAKKQLIDLVFNKVPVPVSFTDLGGVWGVNGVYSFYTLSKYKIKYAFIVDTDITSKTVDKAKGHQNISLIDDNFGRKSVAERVKNVDVIFMFDILLHQVSPDWYEILSMYAGHAEYIIIFNQQWIRDKTVRLLDLGKEEYFQNVPHTPDHPTYKAMFENYNAIHPVHNRPWKDIHNVWQWGITDNDLMNQMASLGYERTFYNNCGRFFNLPNTENHAFIFQKIR